MNISLCSLRPVATGTMKSLFSFLLLLAGMVTKNEQSSLMSSSMYQWRIHSSDKGLPKSLKHCLYVTVHEQIGHNAQKRENRVFLQHHSSGTAMSSELIRGMAVIER